MNDNNLIKKIGNWEVYIQGENDYYPNNLCVTDGYNCYYMNDSKAWDNFYPIIKTVVKWCETTGYNKLIKHINKI